jgi:hypothetical protein
VSPRALNRGLPGRLPEGERILWQGSPDWRVMVRRVFHLRALAAYFGILLAYFAVNSFGRGTPLAEVAHDTAELAALALVPMAVLALYAWGTGYVTTYTITNRRVAIKMGIALPMTMNLPFVRIDGANFRPARDGSGDVALQLAAGERVAYFMLWPHARPWRMAKAEPMLRAVPEAAQVAQILARALAASADMPPVSIEQLQGGTEAATIGSTHPHAAAAA